MRSTLALAATFAAGLAATPALASPATFIDFWIEITSIDSAGANPLFGGKEPGGAFQGELSVTFPVSDGIGVSGQGEFALESLSIDGFDQSFFGGPRVLLGPFVTNINAGSLPNAVFFEPLTSRGMPTWTTMMMI